MRSKMYLVGAFSMAVILYVSTGVQFWLTKYFIDVLGYEAKSVFIAYVIVTVTAPTSGAGFGILFYRHRRLYSQQYRRIRPSWSYLLCIRFFCDWNRISNYYSLCGGANATLYLAVDCLVLWWSNDAWADRNYNVFSLALPKSIRQLNMRNHQKHLRIPSISICLWNAEHLFRKSCWD